MSQLTAIAIRLWRDTRAQSQLEAFIMLVAVVCIGCIVGVATLRGYLLQEFGNAAEALEGIDQSYSIEVRVGNGTTVYAASYDDPGPSPRTVVSDLPACMEFAAPEQERTEP